MSQTIHAKLVIIGSGPAGYTAAIYAARAMLDPILIQGIETGGQLTTTTDVENYPGFADVIQGPWLMEQMQKQAAHVGTNLVPDHVNQVDLASGRSESGAIPATFISRTRLFWRRVPRRAGSIWPSEQKFRGYGVSACATCDGFFYRNKEVLVIGGGNTAVEEALFLTNFANKVMRVLPRDSFRAERILQERLYRNPKISVFLEHRSVSLRVGSTAGAETWLAEVPRRRMRLRRNRQHSRASGSAPAPAGWRYSGRVMPSFCIFQ